jgi:hypothetical protein
MSKEQNFCADEPATSTSKDSFATWEELHPAQRHSHQTRDRSPRSTRGYKAISLSLSIHVECKKYGRFRMDG